MEGMKCVACGKVAKPTKLHVEGTEVSGWKCLCGESYLDSEAVERLLMIRKLKHQKFLATVTKQGNSYAIRVPMAIVGAYHLKNKEKLKIDPELNKIVLEV